MLLNGNGSGRRRALVGGAMPLMIEALVVICDRAGFEVAGRFSDASRARDALLGHAPDMAILDFADGDPSGVDLLRDVRGRSLATRVVLFCGDDDATTPIDAVELGVDGLLLRTASADTARTCIDSVADGEAWLDPRAMKSAYDRMTARQSPQAMLLTRRERDVAKLVATGQRNRGIALALGISEGTVKMHLHNVYAKMGVESRTQLAMDARLRDYA